jgi:hypothetical protein
MNWSIVAIDWLRGAASSWYSFTGWSTVIRVSAWLGRSDDLILARAEPCSQHELVVELGDPRSAATL